MATKTVRIIKPYMAFPVGNVREMAPRLADQLIEGGFAVEVAQDAETPDSKSLSAPGSGRAKRLVLDNKAVGA